MAEAQESKSDTETKLKTTSSVFQKDETDRAIDKGIAFLINQQKENGAIYDMGHQTTMTSLAVMALASVGNQPVDPTPEGRAMKKALAYVLQKDRVDEKGYFGQNDGSRMYGHGITTLMLTELLGMGVSDEQDAIRCIHNTARSGAAPV